MSNMEEIRSRIEQAVKSGYAYTLTEFEEREAFPGVPMSHDDVRQAI